MPTETRDDIRNIAGKQFVCRRTTNIVSGVWNQIPGLLSYSDPVENYRQSNGEEQSPPSCLTYGDVATSTSRVFAALPPR